MENERKIDESWKEKAAQEKNETAQEIPKDFQADFKFFITTLAMQATIALGEVPNPVDNKKETNLPQAKFIIDVLDILKLKTKGNLTQEEEKLLSDLIYGLQMSYSTAAGKENK
ncbi:MAG: DUF1844 domain-containing protein [Candidatus Gygaella obscura]|nr:DUF1844 domain-containing protein [Candidatus Gygaella obscura]